jgi:hypothetical protein
MNGPLSGILLTIGGWAAGILLIAGVIGIIVGAILLVVGSLAKMPDAKSLGWKVILISPIAVIIGGSAAAIISLSQGMKVTG